MGDVIELRPRKGPHEVSMDDLEDADGCDGTHVVFEGESGNQHVYPLSYFEDWSNGLEVDAPPAFVLKQITREWLELLRERG